jgi:hypothetical protein
MSTRGPRYSEAEARAAVAAARSHFDAMVRLGVRPAGGNHATLKKYLALWGISTDHFDWGGARPPRREAIPLDEVLVEGSTYERKRLKRRLVEAGLKELRCEMCGQGEMWRGVRMGLVLDHVNGVWNDNRLENLRFLCPNCNATLDTHCGRKNRRTVVDRECEYCGDSFTPKYAKQRFCSRPCGACATTLPRCTAWSARPTTSCWRRSRRRAIRPSAASTASPTTPSASGSARTSPRRS